MENYSSNSNKSRIRDDIEAKFAKEEEQKERKPESTVEATKHKKSAWDKFVHRFVAEDIESIPDYVVNDILIPRAIDAVHDGLVDSVDMFFGKKRSSRRRDDEGRSYSKIFKVDDRGRERDIDDRDRRRFRGRTRYNFEEFEFRDRNVAYEVLDYLEDCIAMYGYAQVTDFLAKVGEPSQAADNAYGWYSLRGADVDRVSGGRYVLVLPNPERLKD